jgi:integrase
MSQREALELIALEKGAYEGYEYGRNSPDIPTAKKIAKAFGVPFNTLFGDKFKSPHGDVMRVKPLMEKTKHYNPLDVIFCGTTGKPRQSSSVATQLRHLSKKLGIEDLHTHCLRHTFATRGLENGVELKIMQELLGHSSIRTTADVYTHVLTDKKTEEVMKLDGKIGI